AYRAVGMANNRNPIAIVVPCHRVIASDGTLCGYGGGLDVKRRLLELEGALLADRVAGAHSSHSAARISVASIFLYLLSTSLNRGGSTGSALRKSGLVDFEWLMFS